MRARFGFIIIMYVMCAVNIRGHEANFYETEARCHEALTSLNYDAIIATTSKALLDKINSGHVTSEVAEILCS